MQASDVPHAVCVPLHMSAPSLLAVAVGFYDSPFEQALVLSHDGGGNDGTINVFLAKRHDHSGAIPTCTTNISASSHEWDFETLSTAQMPLSLGFAYHMIGHHIASCCVKW